MHLVAVCGYKEFVCKKMKVGRRGNVYLNHGQPQYSVENVGLVYTHVPTNKIQFIRVLIKDDCAYISALCVGAFAFGSKGLHQLATASQLPCLFIYSLFYYLKKEDKSSGRIASATLCYQLASFPVTCILTSRTRNPNLPLFVLTRNLFIPSSFKEWVTPKQNVHGHLLS